VRWTRSAWPEGPTGLAGGRLGAFPEVSDGQPSGRRGAATFWEGVRRVLPSVRTAMEYCWLYPWVVVLGGGFYGDADPLLGPGWAFALMLGGQHLTRSVLARGGPLRRARGVLVCAGVVLGCLAVWAQHYRGVPAWNPVWIGALLRAAHDTLPAVPKPVLAALAAAALWWRGLALGTRDTDAGGIEAAYKSGVAAIVAYLLAAAIYADTAGFRAAGPVLPASMPAFFMLGLSALALARLAVIWDRGQPDERAHVPARGWALLVVGVVGLMLLVASVSAGLAAADVFTLNPAPFELIS
jgi:hypothetical protein